MQPPAGGAPLSTTASLGTALPLGLGVRGKATSSPVAAPGVLLLAASGPVDSFIICAKWTVCTAAMVSHPLGHADQPCPEDLGPPSHRRNGILGFPMPWLSAAKYQVNKLQHTRCLALGTSRVFTQQRDAEKSQEHESQGEEGWAMQGVPWQSHTPWCVLTAAGAAPADTTITGHLHLWFGI